MGRKIILIDFSRCIECRACEVACEREHEGQSLISVFEYQETTAIPLNCRHCEKAPCIEVCPTRALYRDDDGAVILSPLKCIGCLLCSVVCPFGIPILDKVNKVMIKCDLCAHRRAEGKLPACVATCPTDALIYGDVEELLFEKRKKAALQVVESSRSAASLKEFTKYFITP
ncbi:4Fe-4S binding protein [Desulfurococcaceae archaeon MEX13E-LK6-19]|nr:4Fe-4S binding protein [Desulfurococcaceae archaeon MEX13E-LK6-19]